MTPWFGAFATFLLIPTCLYLALCRAMQPSASNRAVLAAASLGLGPLGAGWLLAGLLAVLPGYSDGFFIGAVLSVFALAGVYGSWGSRTLPSPGDRLGRAQAVSGRAKLPWFYAAVLVGLALLLVAQALILPLNGNDPLEYALVGKVLYQAKSLAQYPLRQADPATGLYAGSSHPLGYLSLILWTYLFEGGAFGWLSKAISPYYTLCTLALFLVSRRPDRAVHGVLAGLLLLGAPLYEQTSAICHIDSLRLYAMFLAIFVLDWIPDGRGRPGRPWIILCGVAGGMSLYCHSIGLLTLPFLGVCLVFRPGWSWRRRLAVAAVVCSLALAVGGGRYLRNLAEYGTPLRDNEPVWSLPSINYNAYNDSLKTLTSPFDRLVNGVLTPFTRYGGLTDNALVFFGFSFWLALLAVAWRRRDALDDAMARNSLICLGIFFAVCLASVLVGSSLIIKNVRYFLTVLPFAAYVGAIPAVRLVRVAAGLRPPWRNIAGLCLVLALSGATLAMAGVTLALTVPNLPALAQGDLAFLRRTYGAEYFYPAGYDAVAWVRANTPPDTRILVFRKNEMAFYSNRRILADTDPALLPFYAATDPDAAANILREQGVGYIFVPNYLPPTFTNSQAAAVADDPGHSELVFDRKGYRVYRLRHSGETPAIATEQALPVPAHWLSPAPFAPSFLTEILSPLAAFQSNLPSCGQSVPTGAIPVSSAGVYSGAGPMDLPPSASFDPAPLTGGATYRFTTLVKGTGWLKAFLLFYQHDGGLTFDTLFDGVLREPQTRLSRLAIAPDAAWQYRMLFIAGGGDAFILNQPQLERIGSPTSRGSARKALASSDTSRDAIHEIPLALTAKPGKILWGGAGTQAPGSAVIEKAIAAKQAALTTAALRLGDGVTLLGIAANCFAATTTAYAPPQAQAQLVVEVSGHGRVDCFMATQDGAIVTYIGTLAPCGASGSVRLPFVSSAERKNAKLLFRLEPGVDAVSTTAARIYVPSATMIQ